MLSRVVLALFIAVSSGCSYFKDSNHHDNVINMQRAQMTQSCLSNTIDVLAQYFKRERNSVEKADQVVNCAVDTINLFQTHVKGLNASEYTAKELSLFLDRFFPDYSAKAKESIPVFLRLKSSLLGGATDVLTQDELNKIKVIVESFKPASRALAPFADIYALNIKGKLDEQRFDRAVAVLNEIVASLLAKLPERTNTAFSRDDLQKLLAQFENTKEAASFIPLALAMKQIVVRPPAMSITGEDWKLSIKAASRLFETYLRYHYYVAEYFEPGHSVLADSNPRHLETLAHSVLKILKTGLDSRPVQGRQDPTISGVEFAVLIDELDNKKLLPSKVRADSIKRLIWPITARFLQKGTRAQRPKVGDIDLLIPEAHLGAEELGVLEADIDDFFAGHRMSVALTEATGKYNSRSVGAGFSKPEIRDPKVTGMNRSAVGLAAEAMQTILSGGSRYLVFDQESRLKIVPNGEVPFVTRKDLVTVNMYRVFMQMILRGYGGRQFRWLDRTMGLTEDQTQEFYLDVRSFGVDMDLMDSRVTTAGARSFMEANLFLSVSNGDEYLSLHEALEFFSTIMSAGMNADKTYAKALALCASYKDAKSLEVCNFKNLRKDITNREMLPARFFRSYFAQTFTKSYENLPGMASFALETANNAIEWHKFIKALEDASRAGGYNQSPVEFGDVRVLSTVIHYTESLFTTYDVNRDSILSEKEVARAFPVFQRFLGRLSGVESPLALKKIFSFMIRAGRPPKDKTELGLWAAADTVISVSASRKDIAGIIASLSITSRESKLEEIKKYVMSHQSSIYSKMRSGDEFTARQLMILFQCDPTDITSMRSLMTAKAQEWLKAPVSPMRFALRVDTDIKAHHELSRICVPLF